MEILSPTSTLARARPAAGVTVAARMILLSIVGLLGLQNILLLPFLGQFGPILGASILAMGALLFALNRVLTTHGALSTPVSLRLIAACFGIALVVYLLGGEGRFLYANTDWQVRGAVLHDLAHYPWPFSYRMATGDVLLRAPMGMYLLPAAIAKLTGEGSVDILLLIQNALLLTGVLSLGATLFTTPRSRAAALFLFLGFSGMDCLGEWLVGGRLDVHLEQWTSLQYSGQLTQAFWVPQHSVAGWLGALLYLLWRRERIPVAVFAATTPLIALLSPLGLIGLTPFMAHAGLETLLRRRLRVVDVALPAFALGVALPALLYMAAGSGKVGGAVSYPSAFGYVVSVTLEVGLPLLALFLHGGAHRYGLITSLLVLAMLLFAPFGHIGSAVDFVMRASIPALAILTMLLAEMFITPPTSERQRFAVGLATIAIAIGLATPATEAIRALRFPASPAVLCNYMQIVPGGAATYVAPVSALPRLIRPHDPALIDAPAKTNCWDGPWPAGEVTGLFQPIRMTPGRVYYPGAPQDEPETGGR